MDPVRLGRSVLLGRDGVLRAPWRVAFFLAAIGAAVVVTNTVLGSLFAVTPVVRWARAWHVPLDQYVALVALLLATAATYRLAERRSTTPWREVGLGWGALRWRALAVGTCAGLASIGLPSLLLVLSGRCGFEAQPVVQSWARIAVEGTMLLAPAALVEELAFRGYLLATVRAAIGTPWAVALTSVAFALLHLFNPDPSVVSTAAVALAGFFLAAVRLTTGSL
jgi:membrane protease YdiL (CAAX protease family)